MEIIGSSVSGAPDGKFDTEDDLNFRTLFRIVKA